MIKPNFYYHTSLNSIVLATNSVDAGTTFDLHDIAKRLNFDYKIYVFLQYKFTDIE
ncbi:hypothetical protein ARSQ2_00099 [Arsenophonus endosymbiont of Bemisia tabaci Q2]|nr:hypothetical protein ARSQ2_00099 [Arsenophonus endosymbiont of Bemisia tabaci Q2]